MLSKTENKTKYMKNKKDKNFRRVSTVRTHKDFAMLVNLQETVKKLPYNITFNFKDQSWKQLFLIYLNSKPEEINSYISLFEDDSKLMKEIKSQKNCEELENNKYEI